MKWWRNEGGNDVTLVLGEYCVVLAIVVVLLVIVYCVDWPILLLFIIVIDDWPDYSIIISI